MTDFRRLTCVILFYGMGCFSSFAHETPVHTTTVTGDLGEIHFENSGARAAQADFLRGVLLLHSFEFTAARHAFQLAEQKDPHFAMAYWGEALSHNQPIWGEQDLESARAALNKLASTPSARAALAATPREKAYLSSLESLYGTGDKTSRDARFCAELRALADHYPNDLDARAFYSLALLGLSGTRRDMKNYMQAAAEAQSVLDRAPSHPGALHYLIHAFDDPLHAPLGLHAARLYGQVAPAASHAQHMPSHIFFSLGMWEDAIKANAASLDTARKQGDGGYHSLLWLTYARLQLNQVEAAASLVNLVAHDVAERPTKDNRVRLAYARAMWLVETNGAPGVDARQPIDATGIASISYFSAYDFANGITYARAGHLSEAKQALADIHARILGAPQNIKGATVEWYDTVTPEELEQAKIMAMALEGTLRFYAGDTGGLSQVRQAISDSQGMVFEYGPPWSVKPLDELLGELLLHASQYAEAAAAFEQTLATYPNRRLALRGLAQASAHQQ
jgi:tetratricopeptide (TPR) repeat protein